MEAFKAGETMSNLQKPVTKYQTLLIFWLYQLHLLILLASQAPSVSQLELAQFSNQIENVLSKSILWSNFY